MPGLEPEKVSILGSQITIDANAVAEGLGLDVETLRSEMAKGRIAAIAETGIAENDGRMRLTFRHGARIWRVERLKDGSLRDERIADRRPPNEMVVAADPVLCLKSGS